MDEVREEATKPIYVDEGTPYPARQAHVDFHRSFKGTGIKKGPFMLRIEATNEILRHNRPGRKIPSREQEAMGNIEAGPGAVSMGSQRSGGVRRDVRGMRGSQTGGPPKRRRVW